jgi:orotidine-5'-phosphate decarboxylase
MHSFGQRLADAVIAKKSAVCVGLDPRWHSLPESMTSGIDETDLTAVARTTGEYCKEVIDAVADLVPIVKPQAAFFENLGPSGMVVLDGVIQHARKSGLLVLLDGKRGDIGSTAEGYAAAYLGDNSPWKCDALTVNPYLGDDTLTPFADRATETGCGIFVLVKTSNPGSGYLQDLIVDEQPIYAKIAATVQELTQASGASNGFGNIGAVVGATYPEQLSELRERMPNAWLLIPGYGAQGGKAEDVARGFNRDGLGAIVNSSRGIIFAYRNATDSANWQDAVRKAAEEMTAELNAAK